MYELSSFRGATFSPAARRIVAAPSPFRPVHAQTIASPSSCRVFPRDRRHRNAFDFQLPYFFGGEGFRPKLSSLFKLAARAASPSIHPYSMPNLVCFVFFSCSFSLSCYRGLSSRDLKQTNGTWTYPSAAVILYVRKEICRCRSSIVVSCAVFCVRSSVHVVRLLPDNSVSLEKHARRAKSRPSYKWHGRTRNDHCFQQVVRLSI